MRSRVPRSDRKLLHMLIGWLCIALIEKDSNAGEQLNPSPQYPSGPTRLPIRSRRPRASASRQKYADKHLVKPCYVASTNQISVESRIRIWLKKHPLVSRTFDTHWSAHERSTGVLQTSAGPWIRCLSSENLPLIGSWTKSLQMGQGSS